MRLRDKGAHGFGVADLMKEGGLTHGGFYAHFDSREALVIEAFGYAMDRAAEHRVHHGLRAAEKVRNDAHDHRAETELETTAATGATTPVVLDVLTFLALAPAHAPDVSRGKLRAQ